MMTNWEGEKDNRPFFDALVFERDGDLNLTWLFVLLMGVIGAAGFMFTVFQPALFNTLDRALAWSFLGGAFMGVLIAAIPLAKAKILANSKLPAEFAHAIASAGKEVETSTDIQELSGVDIQTTTESTNVG